MNPTDRIIDVVLCWHMHQPWYIVDGTFERPWVYLHALKDYSDMAAHLEARPEARAVVNFVPTLIEQIERYADCLAAHRDRGTPIPDPLLAALAAPDLPAEPEARTALVRRCLEVCHPRAVARFAPLRELVDFCRPAVAVPTLGRYLSNDCLDALLVWSHVAWIGEWDLRLDPDVQAIVDSGSDVDAGDRRRLLSLITNRLCHLLERYRRLAERGTIELATSPWAHPLVPLLLDFASAREAEPGIALPDGPCYPGGAARVHWHFEEGHRVFERAFGRPPAGCWPPEAALSDATLDVIAENGFAWTVSSGAVLRNSMRVGSHEGDCVHHAVDVSGRRTRVFFRDDGLSDLIGFTYKDWPAEKAVDDLIHHLDNIRAHCDQPGTVVTIALDGENAWEHYPVNGFEFLGTLYARLALHPGLRLTTFGEHLARPSLPARLSRVIAGSWVHGSLATWIGHRDKNLAWDLLIAAKRRFDLEAECPAETARLLAICEGSDWFWWLGDVHASVAVEPFEQLYRAHLAALYRALGLPPPESLRHPLSHGSREADVHTMLPTDD